MSSIRKTILKQLDETVEEFVNDLEQTMTEEAHEVTGALKDSITTEKKGKGKYKVGVDASRLKGDVRNVSRTDYSPMYYYGSRPHIIRAKPGKTLHWVSGGQDHFAKSVKHPGYKGDKFVDRAIQKRKKLK